MRRHWKIAAGIVSAFIIIGIIIGLWAAPIVKRDMLRSLGNQFKSDVQISSIHVIPGRTFYITVNGLVLTKRDHPGFPPMIKIQKILVEVKLSDLFRHPAHIGLVRLTGLDIHIPPRTPRTASTPPRETPPHAPRNPRFVVDELEAPNTLLVLIPRKADKIPLEFQIQQLKMQGAGLGQAAKYHAILTNPKPVGKIIADGSFGPWNSDEPSDTPVSGVYSFTHADMGTIKGLGGTLSSTGQYDGQLDSIHGTGHTDTPDFQLRIAGNPISLQTDFDALIDGGNGDVHLNSVKATLGESKFDVSGDIAGSPGAPGRTITLATSAADARLQDFLRLAVPGNHTLMTGVIGLHCNILIPPGPEDISRKLKLDGSFDVAGAHFKKDIQQKVDTLARKGSGRPNDLDLGDVVSDLRGAFRLDNGTMRFSNLAFSVSGASVFLSGNYNLQSGAVDFRGKLQLKAKISQTQTGIKSWLLKPVDPFFSKHGAGTELPIKITGTRDHISFGTDFNH